MATFDYASLAADVDDIIAEFGLVAVLRRPGTPSGDAYNPTAGTPTFHRVVALDLDMRQYDRTESVLKTQRTLLIRTAEGVVPAKGDRIKIAGAEAFLSNPSDNGFTGGLDALEVRPLAPGGTTLLYEVDIAR